MSQVSDSDSLADFHTEGKSKLSRVPLDELEQHIEGGQRETDVGKRPFAAAFVLTFLLLDAVGLLTGFAPLTPVGLAVYRFASVGPVATLLAMIGGLLAYIGGICWAARLWYRSRWRAEFRHLLTRQTWHVAWADPYIRGGALLGAVAVLILSTLLSIPSSPLMQVSGFLAFVWRQGMLQWLQSVVVVLMLALAAGLRFMSRSGPAPTTAPAITITKPSTWPALRYFDFTCHATRKVFGRFDPNLTKVILLVKSSGDFVVHRPSDQFCVTEQPWLVLNGEGLNTALQRVTLAPKDCAFYDCRMTFYCEPRSAEQARVPSGVRIPASVVHGLLGELFDADSAGWPLLQELAMRVYATYVHGIPSPAAVLGQLERALLEFHAAQIRAHAIDLFPRGLEGMLSQGLSVDVKPLAGSEEAVAELRRISDSHGRRMAQIESLTSGAPGAINAEFHSQFRDKLRECSGNAAAHAAAIDALTGVCRVRLSIQFALAVVEDVCRCQEANKLLTDLARKLLEEHKQHTQQRSQLLLPQLIDIFKDVERGRLAWFVAFVKEAPMIARYGRDNPKLLAMCSRMLREDNEDHRKLVLGEVINETKKEAEKRGETFGG